MKKNPKIKLYIHTGGFVPLKMEKKNKPLRLFGRLSNVAFGFFYYFGAAVIKFFKLGSSFLLGICYYTGSGIIFSITKPYKAAKNDILKTGENFPKRLRILFHKQYAKTLAMFLAVALIGWGGISSLKLVAKALQIKGQVLGTATLGGSYLNKAKDDISKQDFTAAQNSFNLAYETFSRGQDELNGAGQSINQILNLVPQKKDADALLQAASLVSQSGQNFLSLQQDLQNFKVSATGVTSGGQTASENFKDISANLDQVLTRITTADNLVSGINENDLPANDRGTFVDLRGQLQIATTALNNFKQVYSLIENLLEGQKTVLVLFENNNELRAGGGFMGTFGAIKMKDGQISKINVSSIYDLDGQLTDIIKPPLPVLNVSDRWFMRDSNWFADFSQSAKTISGFYEKEGGETPDLVIALTPNIIIDWLKILGPVNMPKYGVTLTPDNFVEQTQAQTTISDNLPTNSPKQMLADLVPILLQRISVLDKSQWPQLIQSLQDNLNNKQIAIYSRDSDAENQLDAFNWAGQVIGTDRDYLSVVSSNLGGTKTDLYIDQKINLTTNISADGKIQNQLTITRTNKLPNVADTENTSFIRIFVPSGSKLDEVLGFEPKALDYPDNLDYKRNPFAYEWEKNSVTDNLTGTTMGTESGKTYFGNWLTLKGGETKTITLTYDLPFNLSDIDRYSLLLQKQLGANSSDFNWTLNFPARQIDWKNFDPDILDTSSLTIHQTLDKDSFYGIVYEKR
jgi:hypothetical protein